jgi:WD40 repeat protein
VAQYLKVIYPPTNFRNNAVLNSDADKKVNASAKKKKVKVRCITVYSEDDQAPIIITGCEDSSLRAWRLKRSNQTGVLKWAMKTHSGSEPICCVQIYRPPLNFVVRPDASHLSKPMIVSCSRDGTVCLTSIEDGSPLSRCWEGHLEAITALKVFPGW